MKYKKSTQNVIASRRRGNLWLRNYCNWRLLRSLCSLAKTTGINVFGLSFCILTFTFCICEAHNIYWANLHSHTALSDGQGTPQEAYLYARDTAQIDILALTDHTSYLTQGNYQYTRAVADSFTESGRFIAIAGQEFGNLSAFGHFSMFEAENLCPVSVYDLVSTYEWVANNKVQTQFNHPRLGDFDDFTYSRNGDKYVSAIEVVNSSGLYTPYYEERYIDALNQGWYIAPVANQDNHHKHWGNATTSLGQIPLTAICADSLTKDAILEAIGKGRIYACEIKPATDKILLKDFSIGDKFMGEIYRSTDKHLIINLEVTASNKFAALYLYKNGVILDSVSAIDTNQIKWVKHDTISSGYYFVKGVQQDGDRFWTGPIWVNYQSEPTGIEAWPNPIKNRSKIVFHSSVWVPRSEMFIYNLGGDLVYKEKKYYPQEHFWDGTDQNGKVLQNGLYYVVIKAYTYPEVSIYKGKVAVLKQ
jgi:hypothetical protein